jgi:hypothetical protein
MNKAQAKQVAMIEVYLSNDMRDTAARSLSALIRSALVNKTAQEFHAIAAKHGLNTHPDFIV